MTPFPHYTTRSKGTRHEVIHPLTGEAVATYDERDDADAGKAAQFRASVLTDVARRMAEMQDMTVGRFVAQVQARGAA